MLYEGYVTFDLRTRSRLLPAFLCRSWHCNVTAAFGRIPDLSRTWPIDANDY